MKLWIVLIALVLISFFLGQWLKNVEPLVDTPHLMLMQCDPSKKPCEVQAKRYKYIIEFEGEASALTAFNVKLNIDNSLVQSIEVVFEMPDMNMGFNRYSLKKNGLFWQSQVILPVCSLSRNDWIMRVKVNLKNEISIAQFEFKQA